ncbi:MAG: PH domain-containing protein [Acidimicrobiia bacterium]
MPSYPEKLINEGETVVLDLKPHWWFFWKHILVGGALLIVLGVWIGPLDSRNWAKIPLAIAILVYVGFVIVKYLTWTYTHFVLTDRRVISRSGIISKRGTEVPLDRVNNIDFAQKFWERLIGAGDLAIESAGKDGQSHFENVRHPDMVQQEVYRQMDVNSRRQAGWHADAMVDRNPAAPPSAASPDVADQIAKLATLRDQGALTSEEFEAKKTELLDRM